MFGILKKWIGFGKKEGAPAPRAPQKTKFEERIWDHAKRAASGHAFWRRMHAFAGRRYGLSLREKISRAASVSEIERLMQAGRAFKRAANGTRIKWNRAAWIRQLEIESRAQV